MAATSVNGSDGRPMIVGDFVLTNDVPAKTAGLIEINEDNTVDIQRIEADDTLTTVLNVTATTLTLTGSPLASPTF